MTHFSMGIKANHAWRPDDKISPPQCFGLQPAGYQYDPAPSFAPEHFFAGRRPLLCALPTQAGKWLPVEANKKADG
jgi:hypothetical protein